ncbi:MAG: glycosyltransferase family 2 protein, partial [Bacteroidales bacterium]|nr:glycosyltransferase family 2 protein [Bacteroidales bacterium]
MMNGISVVICCYNSEQRLPKVLDHLNRQILEDHIPWEVVVVDNASGDRTAEVARDLWKRTDAGMKVVSEPNPGLSHARMKGIAESSYDIISFIDDDNWVESGWIQKVYHIMNNDPKIGIMGGHGEAVFESDPPEWFEKFQSAYAVGSDGKTTGKQRDKRIKGAGMNMRRESWEFLNSNGFEFLQSDRKGSALSSGGDIELCLAFLLAGFDLYYDDDLRFYHYMPAGRLTWEYLLKLYGAFGRADPIESMYVAFVNEKGFRLFISTNILISTLRTLKDYVNFLPRR